MLARSIYDNYNYNLTALYFKQTTTVLTNHTCCT